MSSLRYLTLYAHKLLTDQTFGAGPDGAEARLACCAGRVREWLALGCSFAGVLVTSQLLSSNSGRLMRCKTASYVRNTCRDAAQSLACLLSRESLVA